MTVSGYLLTILGLVVLGWDAVAVTFFGLEGSESYWFNRVGRAYPSFIFWIGYLCGHFFGRMIQPVKPADGNK